MNQSLPDHADVVRRVDEILAAVGVAERSGELTARTPITGGSLGATGSPADVDTAVAIAVEAFGEWRTTPAPLRGGLVRRLGELLREHKSDAGELVSIEAGKIRSEGLGEVQEMIDICDFAVGLSRQLHGLTIASERPGHRLMETWHPMGPCAVITAFNFPVAVWSWNAALALVAGDPVLWKPSDKTPLTALACDALFRARRRPSSARRVASTRCSKEVPTSVPLSSPTPMWPSCRRPDRRGWAVPSLRPSPVASPG